MSILYIDESGTDALKKSTDIREGNSKYFIMAGILIETKDLEDAFYRFDAIKDKYFKDKVFELKSSFKNLHFKEEYSKFNQNELKQTIKTEVYSAIQETNCLLFGVQINKVPLCDKGILKNKNETYHLAFLNILRAVLNYKKSHANDDNIIIILDSREKQHNKRMYKLYREAIEQHSEQLKGFNSKDFSPTLNFVDSSYTFGVQLADFVAGALWRGVEKDDKKYSRMLKEKFPTNNGEFVKFSYIVVPEF
ncbi:DUF3800 domain-containing protein [Ligilactobacillus salivarius]|uniref:DUF3800 domain-containing protein n=1 Tax=Ligilactobacillus salivarius TaxID=1624 RepID=UPI0015D78E0B|nr:DUF3800 domain-containing protein [Ligilactobacillus salivarius]